MGAWEDVRNFGCKFERGDDTTLKAPDHKGHCLRLNHHCGYYKQLDSRLRGNDERECQSGTTCESVSREQRARVSARKQNLPVFCGNVIFELLQAGKQVFMTLI